MSFYELLQSWNWDEVAKRIEKITQEDVRRVLSKQKQNSLDDFLTLISPAASPFLEKMAGISRAVTRKRFGKTMQMYVPLYLSNYCSNSCVYCGFNRKNKQERKILSMEEIRQEVEVIKSMGYQHVLLVTGEAPSKAGMEYFQKVLDLIRSDFSQISMEIQPLDQKEYESLIKKGLNSVYVYQETYHERQYSKYHPAGKKADYKYRLETPDRLGKAGIYKIGLGSLIGLEDWRTEAFFLAMHLEYLEKKYWKSRFSVSFPRLRPHSGGYEPNVVMSDRELVQLITAYRLFNDNLDLSLSTRESAHFRNHALQLGITSISAGSRTDPGGYSAVKKELKQFEINDDRTPEEVAAMVKSQGYEAVWKDWDSAYGSL